MTDTIHHYLGYSGLTTGALATGFVIDRVGHALEVGAAQRLGGTAIVAKADGNSLRVRAGAETVLLKTHAKAATLGFQVRTGIAGGGGIGHAPGLGTLCNVTGQPGRQI